MPYDPYRQSESGWQRFKRGWHLFETCLEAVFVPLFFYFAISDLAETLQSPRPIDHEDLLVLAFLWGGGFFFLGGVLYRTGLLRRWLQ